MMWRIIIAVVLIMHGIGHVMGVFPALGLWTIEGQSSRSWLLSDVLGETGANWLSILVWMVALLGFVGAGFGILGWMVPFAWWRSLAITAAVISILGLVLYWNAFYTIVNKAGALGVDIIVLVALLWMSWPSNAVLSAS